MAFTTMHFAVGMAGGGAMALMGCAVLGRGWRYTPLAMTFGGVWAIVPDLPRLFTEDFPNLPLASLLGGKPLQHWLDAQGNWFFLHRVLDEQPREFALHGLFGILVLYNLAILALLLGQRRHQSITTEQPQCPVAADGTASAPDVLASIGPASRTGNVPAAGAVVNERSEAGHDVQATN